MHQQGKKRTICSSCNMGTSDLPEIYTRALGLRPRALVYISGKSQVPASAHGNCWNALRAYLYGTM